MNFHQIDQWLLNNIWYGENGTPHKRRVDSFVQSGRLFALIPPPSGKVWGIDISHWNRPPVDLKRMKDLYGLSFVIIKGHDGTIKSRYFDEHVAAAKYAGLPWGIYDWLYPSSKVNIEAQVTEWARQYNADPAPLGVAIDAEWTYYGGVPVNPTANDLRAAQNSLKAKIGNHTQNYTAKGYADQYLKGFDWTKEPLWIANYGVNNPALPSGATTYRFWQFTSTLDGKILDPNGNLELDGNYYNGTPAQFAAEYGYVSEPSPAPSEYKTFRRFESDCHLITTDPKKYRVFVTNTRGQFIKTSLAAQQFGAKYAINGDLYTANKPDSLACSDGDLYQPVQMEFNPFFNSTRTGELQFGHKATPDLFNTVSGSHYLVQAGTVNVALFTHTEKHPRTAVGVDAAGNIMLLVVEGRDSTDAGTTLAQTAQILIELGAQWAINLDGGGSSTLCMDGQVKNYLSDGSERAVINHLLLIPLSVSGETMAKYTLKNVSALSNLTLRGSPCVIGGNVDYIRPSEVAEGDMLIPHTRDAVLNGITYAKAGDKWLHVTKIGTRIVDGYSAVIHKGVPQAELTTLPDAPSADLSQLTVTGTVSLNIEGNVYSGSVPLSKA